MLFGRALLPLLLLVPMGCGAAAARQRELPPLVNPAVRTSPTTTAAVRPEARAALPVGLDASTVDGLCGGWCDKEAYVAATHPALGLGRFTWLHSPIGGAVGPVFEVDGEVRWSLSVGDTTAHVRRAAMDALGHVFFQLDLGDGGQQVVVLVPTADGFTDLHTLARDAPWRGAVASYGDTGDGAYVVRVDRGSGPVDYRWDGSEYVTR